MRLLTAKIDEGLYDRFQAACARDGVSMSDRLRTFVGEVADGMVVVAPVGDAGPLPAHPLVTVGRDRILVDGEETVVTSAGTTLPRGSREPVKAGYADPVVTAQHDGAISRLAAAKHRGALREAMDVPAVPGESCGHAELNKLPYGTWCKDCGRRMR